MKTVEKVKSNFDLNELKKAREKTLDVLQKIAARIHIGMSEEEAHKVANEVIKAEGSNRFWHRTHVRFGTNTLKTYSQPSEKGIILKKNDIFFIDIGPVWDGYEGDGGSTFVVGDDEDMLRCSTDVKDVFEKVRNHWLRIATTGQELYAFASTVAHERG